MLAWFDHDPQSDNISFDLQAQCNVSIPVVIVLLEHVRHPLKTDARLHEQIEAHGVLTAAVVCAVQQRDELL
jgi:hypothetical protein